MAVPGTTYRFGPFRLEREAYRLLRDDTPLALPPKVIDLLFLLVARPMTLVSKDDILAALWPDVAVTDNAITQVVSELRRVLGDRSAAPRFIETVPRRGYRFISPVEADGPDELTAGPEADAPVVRAIAVVEFLNVTGDADVAWLGVGLAETVTSDLRVIRDLHVIDRVLVVAADPMGGSVDAARAAGADLVVVGSFQHAGPKLRITARVIDVVTGETMVHAKADGDLTSVFELQDAIVRQLLAGLRLNVTPAAAARLTTHETSSLEAFRAVTEGRARLEALDPGEVPGALACFARALELDPAYAAAHVGLAHARFWRFQASRSRPEPEVAEWVAAIEHAERAVALDPELAEAHAALAFVLAGSDRSAEAVAAGRRAVALEPGNWRHRFRLGIAAWGEERLEALRVTIAQFPQMAYASLALAMVYIARAELSLAADALRSGLTAAAGSPGGSQRFPASGLHWLLGLVRLAQGDQAAAQAEFRQEFDARGSRMYADEYAVHTCRGLGFLELHRGDAAAATGMFERALERLPHDARSLAGLSAARAALGRRVAAEEAHGQARAAIASLRAHGRATDAAMAEACLDASSGRLREAVGGLQAMLDHSPPGLAGWSIPVEPWLASCRGDVTFRRVLKHLASRAR